MKSIQEMPPVLTVHRNGTEYIMRVTDVRDRKLVVELSKHLPDATALVLITPGDIKVFQLNGENQVEPQSDVPEIDPEVEAEQESHTLPNSEVQDAPRTVKRKKAEPIAGKMQPCGRCSGQGKIQIIMDGGSPTETNCPVCSGSGEIRRYGARR